MQQISKQIQNILQQDMDRKEFLSLVGASLIGVIGISKILKSLESFNNDSSSSSKANAKAGYGASAYGE